MLCGGWTLSASVRRLSGPAQRAGRLLRTRGSAAQASTAHPLEYQMYYAI